MIAYKAFCQSCRKTGHSSQTCNRGKRDKVHRHAARAATYAGAVRGKSPAGGSMDQESDDSGEWVGDRAAGKRARK